MTTAAGTVAATDLDVRPRRPSRLARAAGDTLAITGRNLRAMQRVPQVIVFSTIQPIVFVLLFRYVFGGAIKVPGIRYVDFLMPGIFVQTITFGAINTGVGLSADLATGMIERFRSLPMARSAVLAGRTFADLVRNAFVLLLMVVVGLLVGFRPDDGPALAGALVLVLLFSFALSWIFALVGLRSRNPEAAQAIAFPVIAPLVFASSAFVSLDTMPGWLQVFARNQPVTQTIEAVRALTLGEGPTARPALQAVLWAVGIIAVCAPLAARGYRRAA